ncbi:MAG: helix-turn-helix domain-containing protein [Gemmataceae bacterium]
MFGEELRKAREKADLTQEQLAFRAGVHRTYISLLEREIKSPTLNTLFRICAAMNIPASTLIAKVEKGMNENSGNGSNSHC